MTPTIEERYIPLRDPWLSSWCRYHQMHLVAIEQIDDEIEMLRAAVNLADAKYRLWMEYEMALMAGLAE